MIVLIGPSASGKTEIGKELSKYGFKKIVTYTTRKKRSNEIDGIDYHFISEDEFYNKKNNGFFFETTKYNGNYYGTSKGDINDNTYVILEPNGLDAYKHLDHVVTFYIYAPKEERKQRMINRLDDINDINRRLEMDELLFNVGLGDYSIDTKRHDVKKCALIAAGIHNKIVKNGIIKEFFDDVYQESILNDSRIATRGVILNDKNEVGIVHIKCEDIFGCREHYEIPGGGYEPYEDAEGCLRREIEEELGVTIKDLKYLGAISYRYNVIKQFNLDDVFMARVEKKTKNSLTKEEKECFDRIEWINIYELKKLLEKENKNVGILVQRRDLFIINLVLDYLA